MRRTIQLLATGWLAAMALPSGAVAGPNARGTLVIHVNEGLTYSFGAEYGGAGSLRSCRDAKTNVKRAHSREESAVWFVYAAFPEKSSPRMAGVRFGVDYDSNNVSIIASGVSRLAELEQCTSRRWPKPGTGIGLRFTTTQVARLLEVCWFAGYNYSDESRVFEVRAHPTMGGFFLDGSVPVQEDPVAAFGQLGFGQDGCAQCPD